MPRYLLLILLIVCCSSTRPIGPTRPNLPGPLSLLSPRTYPCPSAIGTAPHQRITSADSPLSALLTRAQYETFFPHHNPIYTYESLLTAAAAFPLFTGEGDSMIRKRELAAFFAHIAHETTNGWSGAKGGPYVWGLYYIEEQACRDGHCTQYNTGGTSPYQPVTGKAYFGRGPLQLSYAYNYGLAGSELGLPLLAHPELVATDGTVSFKTALWFWMRDQRPKPSCHDVICGKWQPTPEDLKQHRHPGFGMTINIINGGVECNSNVPAVKDLREERIGFYKWFAARLHVDIEKDCDCRGMGAYGN